MLTVEITKERYDYLVKRDQQLSLLEAGGVDNWDGYHELGTYEITVNGKKHTINDDIVEYSDVAKLAGLDPMKMYTATYSNDYYDDSGSLVMGDSVDIKDGTIFNIADTSNA